MSHPLRVRGLKPCTMSLSVMSITSHPLRVRGLKLYNTVKLILSHRVAPPAGAWIETCFLAY